MSDLAKMAEVILDEDEEAKASVISLLARFFLEEFDNDPVAVGEWLTRNETSADLFYEFANVLCSPQDTSGAPHD
jgi:hypothetical protein